MFDWSWLKKPGATPDGHGTVLNRPLTITEVHENFLGAVGESWKTAWAVGDIKPWSKNAAALRTVPICSGTAGAVVVPGTERRIGMTLASSAHWDLVNVGDIITRDPTTFDDMLLGGVPRWSTVVGKRATGNVIFIDRDIYTASFPYTVYRVFPPSGWLELTGPLRHTAYALTPGRVTTGTTTDKLIDSGGDFVVRGVSVGDIAVNARTGLSTVVTAIDSATQLSVQWHAFATTGDAYALYSRQIVILSGPHAGRFVLEMNRQGIYVGADMTGGISLFDQQQRHGHTLVAHTGLISGSLIEGVLSIGSSLGNTPFNVALTITSFELATAGGFGSVRTAAHTRPRTITNPYIMRIE